MRNVGVSWLGFSVSVMIAVGGCAATGAIGSSGAASNEQTSALIAARQADRAQMNGCLARTSQAAQAAATGSGITQMRQTCMAHANDNVRRIRDRQIADDPSTYGKFVRAIVAAQNAETAGNNQEALRIYKAIDAEAEVFGAEANRLSPPGINARMDRDPEQNLDIINGNGMRLGLAKAQAKIGISYECAQRYPEAANYYQKALNTNGTSNGDGMMIGERLGFLYANGLGMPKDEAKARDLFSVIASQRAVSDLLHPPPSAKDQGLCPG